MLGQRATRSRSSREDRLRKREGGGIERAKVREGRRERERDEAAIEATRRSVRLPDERASHVAEEKAGLMTQRQAEIPKRSRFQPRLARRTDQIHPVETTNPSLTPPHLPHLPVKMMSQSLRASVSGSEYRLRR
jgi:hypothetical protein